MMGSMNAWVKFAATRFMYFDSPANSVAKIIVITAVTMSLIVASNIGWSQSQYTIVPMVPFKIVAGGQTGVDRAALDVAIELSVEYGGWCPKGGWAEDLVSPPGLLERYPKLKATPLADIRQRTEWNVRDSDATLILLPGSEFTKSEGTEFTRDVAVNLGRKYLLLDLKSADAVRHAASWLKGLGTIRVLNIAGPRESEAPGIYEEAKVFLRGLLRSK